MGTEAWPSSDVSITLQLWVSDASVTIFDDVLINDSYYGVIIPSIFNLVGMCGFCILNGILGGQTLSSVSGGSLSWR